MSSVNYENQILDAIETLVDSAVSKAGYDKTIKATIISLEDEATGKYKVKYQDSEIEAYSNNVNLVYPEGVLVYISIPGNDFSQTKTIVGAVDKENVEYVAVLGEDEQYSIQGGNAIAATQEFSVCSYHKNEIKYLYNRDTGINDINLDTLAFAESIENSNQILCGAKFRTELDDSQRKGGNYGIVFELDFKDNLTELTITKGFKIDINRILGTPYDLNNFTRQYSIFKVNSENFQSIKSIYIFCDDFPNARSAVLSTDIDDIFIKDFELYGLRELTDDELNGYSLSLKKIGKGYFDKESINTDTVEIQANLKNQGKDNDITEVNYYWFKENNEITMLSNDYINIGGDGWACINKYNQTDSGTKLWLTIDNICSITKTECKNGSIKIKCVAMKNNEVIAESIISVFNYAPDHTIEIISDQGTQFYFDNGNPTLTCLVDGAENNNYTYIWSSVDSNNTVTKLDETTVANAEYNQALIDYEGLEGQIATGKAMPAASQEELNELLETLNEYKYIQRVEGNKIYAVNISQIIDSTTFKCMVKDNNTILGIATITLTNSLAIEGEYKLNILNGTQTFSYNDMGVSPASETADKPIKIQPLSFEIIDNLGNRLGDNILEKCNIQWQVPTQDTLLIGENSNNLVLNYSIAERYDNTKLKNNNIKLTVKYKNIILETETMFTFVKDGEPGTNGTDIVCKIVPNTTEVINDYPMLKNGTPNFTPAVLDRWFKIELWQSGQKIWSGTSSDAGHTVKWSILKNTYVKSNDTAISESTNIDVNASTGAFTYNGYNNANATIIKGEVTYLDRVYYCTLPLILVTTVSSDYNIKLKTGTGFRYVMYSSDGKRPQYDNVRPFELQVTQLINGYIEDISDINNNYKPTYNWGARGKIFSVTDDSFVDDINLTAINNAYLAGNRKFFIPKDSYSGENITNAVEVEILTNTSAQIGKILIPIHFYLDKYGLSALNGWDGNRISLDNETGSILSPQVGAGKKESDNTFSGVLIGSIKERKSDITEEGLFGYYHGQRSIFLDSNTGKAEFGFAGSGQIIIDPSQNSQKALIYGGNYVSGTSGMLIDLSTPEIKFGNGKFTVSSGGILTATGADISGKVTITDSNSQWNDGTIGGWKSTSDGLKNATSSPTIILSASGISKTVNGTTANMVFYANGNFGVDTSGKLYATGAAIEGAISATSGTFGKGTNKITINNNSTNSAIYSGSKSSYTANASGFYIGTDGISLGEYANNASAFQVSTTGVLTAKSATITGTVNATAGTFGNGTSKITIGTNGSQNANSAIYYGKNTFSSNSSGFYIGTDGIALGTVQDGISAFQVTNSGALSCRGATINGNLVTSQGVLSYFSVDGLNAINEDIYTDYAWNFFGFFPNDEGGYFHANKTYFEFKITIPDKFEVEQARIVFYHNPVDWILPTEQHTTGTTKNIIVQKVSLDSAIIGAAYNSEFFYDDVSTPSDVSVAGTVTDFSPNAANIKSTNNFASAFKNNGGTTVAGTYIFRAITNQTRPSDLSYTSSNYQSKYDTMCANCAPHTGWCEASLEVIGYKKL